MKLAIAGIVAISCAGQPAARFEIADVHAATSHAYSGAPRIGGGRYEMKAATMVDLVRNAYDFTADKIVGGPSWLEMDRFDIVAKLPAGATPETEKLMLQALLAERFALALHKDTRPFPVHAVTVGGKPRLKEGDGTGETGCRQQPASGAPSGGGTVQYHCRNMTMGAFAEGLRRMAGAATDPIPVLDETGLKGVWNFDLAFSPQLNGLSVAKSGEAIALAGAIEQQLGLKLEERQVPMPVLVVDSVNHAPSANPPGVSEALPTIPVPTKFAVASVKPSDPSVRTGRVDIQPGGRVTIQRQPMQSLLSRAFDTGRRIVAPAWANTADFDVFAEAEMPAETALDADSLRPMMLALLVDRFKMTYHREERPVTVYALLPAKPKMKKADPSSRTGCKLASAPAGSPPATMAEACQNVTMAWFAGQLQGIAGGSLEWPVVDGTGIEGGWDFTLVFVRSMALFGARQAGPAAGDAPAASDPSGGYSIFEALEKELGLKLELQKRPMEVVVIDHLEERPTEN